MFELVEHVARTHLPEVRQHILPLVEQAARVRAPGHLDMPFDRPRGLDLQQSMAFQKMVGELRHKLSEGE